MVVKDRLLNLHRDPNLRDGKVKFLVNSIGPRKYSNSLSFVLVVSYEKYTVHKCNTLSCAHKTKLRHNIRSTIPAELSHSKLLDFETKKLANAHTLSHKLFFNLPFAKKKIR